MKKTPDRRVQRTRRLLHKALMSCILEKKYESITVQEILNRADVGRSTFYVHFRDKDELLVSGFGELQSLLSPRRRLQRGFQANPTKGLLASVSPCSSMLANISA